MCDCKRERLRRNEREQQIVDRERGGTAVSAREATREKGGRGQQRVSNLRER